MINLNREDVEVIMDSLRHNLDQIAAHTGYPSEDFRRAQHERVAATLAKVRGLRDQVDNS
jgi:hypothetical protein